MSQILQRPTALPPLARRQRTQAEQSAAAARRLSIQQGRAVASAPGHAAATPEELEAASVRAINSKAVTAGCGGCNKQPAPVAPIAP